VNLKRDCPFKIVQIMRRSERLTLVCFGFLKTR
jgi:hypothetical protein